MYARVRVGQPPAHRVSPCIEGRLRREPGKRVDDLPARSIPALMSPHAICNDPKPEIVHLERSVLVVVSTPPLGRAAARPPAIRHSQTPPGHGCGPFSHYECMKPRVDAGGRSGISTVGL